MNISKNSYELFARMYHKSNEIAAIILNGALKYCNEALNAVAGRDVQNEFASSVFGNEFDEKVMKKIKDNDSVFVESIKVLNRDMQIRAFRYGEEIFLVCTTLDELIMQMRKNSESFTLLRNAHNKLIDAITVINSTVEMVSGLPLEKIPEKMQSINECTVDVNVAAMEIMEIMHLSEDKKTKGCKVGDLGALVNQITETLEIFYRPRRIGIDLQINPETFTFYYNDTSMKNLLLRIINHSLRRAGEGSTVKVQLKDNGNNIQIVVKDTAGKLADEYEEFISKPNVSELKTMLEKYGEELYLVRRIATHYDGELKIGTDGVYTTFTVTLPRQQMLIYINESLKEFPRKESDKWWKI